MWNWKRKVAAGERGRRREGGGDVRVGAAEPRREGGGGQEWDGDWGLWRE